MDILEYFSNTNDKDIIVSLPKDNSWLEYLAQFLQLQAKGFNLEIILPDLPRTGVGRKCYIIYDCKLRGWMEISRVKENEENDIVIELTPVFNPVAYKVRMNDIEGYKYYFDNSNMQ